MRKLALALLAAAAALAQAQNFTFVVAGDGRTDSKAPDPTGINMPVVTKLFARMKKENPRFLLWTGDLIHGVYDDKVTTPVATQFDYWKQASNALSGVTLLPVRGNHELAGDKEGKEWQRAFGYELSHTDGLTFFPGEEPYSYLYVPPTNPKVAVIAVDQYIDAHRVNLKGLEGAMQRAKNGGAKNIFVYAHEMAFTCCSHPDSDNLSKFPKDRDAFLELLRKFNVRYFFAGHDHTYDWMVIHHPSWPASYSLNQIVAGTAGAPFYADKGYFGDKGAFTLTRKEHKDGVYGYLLVTIDKKDKATVVFKRVE